MFKILFESNKISNNSKQLFENKQNLENQELKHKYRILMTSEMEVRQRHFTNIICNNIEKKMKEQELELLRNEKSLLLSEVSNDDQDNVEQVKENIQNLNDRMNGMFKELVLTDIINKGDSKKFREEKKKERKGWFSKYFIVCFQLSLFKFLPC